MNLIYQIGRLTKDPEEVKGTEKKLCKLNLAVSENYTKADGTRPVQFFIVAVWGKMAEHCLKYLTKGSQIAVVGKPQNRSWEDENGVKRYAMEIVANEIEFLHTKKKDDNVNDTFEQIDEEADGMPF